MNTTGLHPGELRRAHQVPRRRIERAANDDVIGLRDERVEIDLSRAEVFELDRIDVRIGCEERDIEHARHPQQLLSDPARADDSERAAGEAAPHVIHPIVPAPLRVSRSFSISLPASARMNVSATVATGRGIDDGVLVTMTPARVMAETSTESNPTPWRATTRKRRSSRNTAAPGTVGMLTYSASYRAAWSAVISRVASGRYSHSRWSAVSRISSAAWPNAGCPRESRMSRVRPTRNLATMVVPLQWLALRAGIEAAQDVPANSTRCCAGDVHREPCLLYRFSNSPGVKPGKRCASPP